MVPVSNTDVGPLVAAHLERIEISNRLHRNGFESLFDFIYTNRVPIGISVLGIGLVIIYLYFGGPDNPGNGGDGSAVSDALGTIIEKLPEVPGLVYGIDNSIYSSKAIKKVYEILMQNITEAIDILLEADFGTVGQEYWIQYYLNPVVREFYLFFHLCAEVANASGAYLATVQIGTLCMPYETVRHYATYGLHDLPSVAKWSLAAQTVYMMVTFSTRWAKSVAPEMFYDLVELLDLVKDRGIFANIPLDRYPDVDNIMPRHLFDNADLIHHFLII